MTNQDDISKNLIFKLLCGIYSSMEYCDIEEDLN